MKRYDWGDGKGRVHSRPKRTRTQLREAVRAKRLNNDPLYDPSKPLAGTNLRKAADALVGLEFGPQRRALKLEAAQAQTQGAAVQDRASDYFLQLAKAEQGNVDRSKAIGDLLGSRISEAGQTAQSQLDAAQQKSGQVMGQDAAVRGQGLSGGSTALAENLAAARARAASSQQTASTEAASGTASYQQLADLSRRAREVRGGETVQQLGNQVQSQLTDIASRRAALESSVGPKRVEQLLGLRQQGFENAATAQGLDLDMAKLRADMQSERADQRLANKKLRATVQQNRARNKLTQQQINATLRGQDISAQTQRRGQDIAAEVQRLNRESREAIAKANRRGKNLEPADARSLKRQIVSATVGLQATEAPRFDGKTYKNRVKWLQDQNVPPIVIKAARERAAGGLRLSTVSELRRLGMKVPRAWIGKEKGPVAP